jgi:hypothetical protein
MRQYKPFFQNTHSLHSLNNYFVEIRKSHMWFERN